MGTTAGVGVGTFRQIVNPGVGATQVFIPSQGIYILNHGLQTGDIVTYQTSGTALGIKTSSAIPTQDTLLD